MGKIDGAKEGVINFGTGLVELFRRLGLAVATGGAIVVGPWAVYGVTSPLLPDYFKKVEDQGEVVWNDSGEAAEYIPGDTFPLHPFSINPKEAIHEWGIGFMEILAATAVALTIIGIANLGKEKRGR